MFFVYALAAGVVGGCGASDGQQEAPVEGTGRSVQTNEAVGLLSSIRLPSGFRISVYAEDVPDARSMALSPSGVLYVGDRVKGKVYALRDADGDGVAEERHVVAKNLRMPNGVAYRGGSLYVAEVHRLLRYDDIDRRLASPPVPKVIYSDYPADRHHGWKYIAFGPDGKLYVPVGAPCNICKSSDPRYASITRMNPDGSGREVFAHGVRNTVGFAWHPTSGELWFTDNGRDWLGDELPPCELNRAPRAGMHFGYPYCHGRDIADPEYGSERSCSDFTPPAQALDPHVAPLGMLFYQGRLFPDSYRGQIFIAEHGSWNRKRKIGYRIALVRLEGNRAVSYEPFADGWLSMRTQKVSGRPVALQELPDGSLLVSDDYAGKIYRISYRNRGE